ncbi:MAG: NADH dehydrogenase FAD-containing subunit [Actinobacteria bacterium]|nr:NADH dehydrogenase FAD-containing subunit [Actinomycetota bacterium]MSX82493.1 NADH dehydrogenase FAD-containing subunit [Actinomycetota bacterium]MSZ30462.1 NADH dehydrogenase FAD-containing subunit [Actinomycetota bacterium]
MSVTDAMRTMPSSRAFTDAPIDDATLYRVLDSARFAPSGGNRQPWSVLVVRDASLRNQIAELAQQGWNEYAAYIRDGLVPFGGDEHGRWPGPRVDLDAAAATHSPNSLIDGIVSAPALLIILADLTKLAVLDAGLDRQSIVGGGSVYPFAHNIMLAARSEGLGGVMTTFLCRREAQVRSLLGFPEHIGIASMIALGEPVEAITRLKRRSVEEFTQIDRWGGEPFTV